ncbi:hypothetical protein [uncultured Eubacterium sp.]|uniref:hypothetical protein n=1 Tax=uncultured Eubacterium sp. TaxID=165185 RepID=UPI00280572A9|nr:hypothetical protein [uncultured Eubacterium sp.]
MIFSVPDYMNISSIELEPTMRVHITSDLNIIKEVQFEQSNKELQRLIKRANLQQGRKTKKLPAKKDL